jgi:thymidine phosphorylase
VVCLGGGRRKVGDRIDHQVGIRVHGRVGDFFEKSQPVMTLHCSVTQADEYIKVLADSFDLSSERVESRPLVLERLGIPSLE